MGQVDIINLLIFEGGAAVYEKGLNVHRGFTDWGMGEPW
jgi:hypothetical protein